MRSCGGTRPVVLADAAPAVAPALADETSTQTMVEIQNRFTDDTASPDCGKWGQPHFVGAPGFEPGTSWSQTRRANQAALRPVPTIVTHLMNSSFAYATIRRLAMRTS